MVTKKTALILLIVFLAVVSLIHTFIQFTVLSPSNQGISGLSIDGSEVSSNSGPLSTISMIVLFSEWTLLIILIVASRLKNRKERAMEYETIGLLAKYKHDNNTDLDILYSILKEKKHLNIKTIAKMFNVDKDVAKEWCETLESGDLATLHYPRIGDPEVVINEK